MKGGKRYRWWRVWESNTYAPEPKPQPQPPPKPSKHEGLNAWKWWSADIIWSNGANTLGVVLGHVGIVMDRQRTEKRVIDAMPGKGVRKMKDLDKWANSEDWTKVRAYRYKFWDIGKPGYPNTPNMVKRRRAVEHAVSVIGKPYGLIHWDKDYGEEYYCSQLVWQVYYKQGVDLDRNGGIAVTPEDIVSNWRKVKRFNASNI